MKSPYICLAWKVRKKEGFQLVKKADDENVTYFGPTPGTTGILAHNQVNIHQYCGSPSDGSILELDAETADAFEKAQAETRRLFFEMRRLEEKTMRLLKRRMSNFYVWTNDDWVRWKKKKEAKP